MSLRFTALVLPIAGAATLAAASSSGAIASSESGAQLTRFAGCGDFLDYVKPRAVKRVGPYGLGGGPMPLAADVEKASPTPGVDYSTTNVQEAGVDEPDIVKTDGEKIVAIAGGKLRVVGLGKTKPELVASFVPSQTPGLLVLWRDRAIVVSQSIELSPLPAGARGILPVPSQTVLTDVDLSTPGRPRIVRTLTLDSAYLDARLVGSSLRVVFTSRPPIELESPKQPGPAGERQAVAKNREAIRGSRARDWLPTYTLRNRRTGLKRRSLLLGCSHVSRPTRFSGFGVLSVVTFDLRKGLVPADTDGLMMDGQTIYASPDSLYVASQRWTDPSDQKGRPPLQTTAIHRFDISDPLRTRYRASGEVSGYVQDQFALSEWNGVLRVATTEFPLWWGGARTDSESYVTTLEERGDRLVRIGRIGGLGRGERIYGVRFIGDVGYVVTFRQVDPLYLLDLSRPAKPVVRGELKIRGYSAYLHPLGPDLLLGLGQDATEEGRVLGTQLSLFDVSDARRPALLERVALGKSWTEAEWDYHAFLYWPRAALAVFPVQASVVRPGGGEQLFSGAVAVRVRRTSLQVEKTITHPGSAAIRRALVVGDTLYTLSDAGLKGSSVDSLSARSWLPF